MEKLSDYEGDRFTLMADEMQPGKAFASGTPLLPEAIAVAIFAARRFWMTVVKEGLASASRESFFSANLYTVKGEIHEANAQKLDADPATKARATDERHQAIESFEASNKIDKKLQAQLMESR